MFSSALAVSSFFALSTGVNFVLGLYLAARFGAAAEMDAFVASTTIPVFIGMVAGSIAYPLQVNVVHTRERSSDKQAWEVCLGILLISGGAALAIAIAVALWARPLMNLTVPGLAPEVAALSCLLLRLQTPVIVLSVLTTVLGAWHNAVHNFLVPALALLVSVLTTLITVVAGASFLGVEAVAIGSTAGTLLQLLTVSWGLEGRHRLSARPDFSHRAVRRILTATMPLVLGAAYVKTDAPVDRYLASALPPGSISQLAYGWGLTAALAGIVMTGLATTSLSAMAGQIAGDELCKLRETFVSVARMIAFIIAPLVVMVVLTGPGLVALLLQRGRFTAADSHVVGLALACYAGLLIGHPAGLHLSNTFYATHDTRTPTLCLAASYTLGIVLKFLLVGRMGVLGLAAATSTYYLLNWAVMSALVARRFAWTPRRQHWQFAAKIARCIAIMAMAVWIAKKGLAGATVSPALVGLVCAVVGGAAYVAAGLAIKLPESRMWLNNALSRLGAGSQAN